MRVPKLLIVSPAFHGYYEAFRLAFDAVGFDTRVALYDNFSTLSKKVYNKLVLELPERAHIDRSMARKKYLSAPPLQALAEFRPDYVIVIKGDSLSDEWWERLEAARVPYVVWIYDEVRRMNYSPDRLSGFPKIATYSAEDTKTLHESGSNVRHIANGFDSFLTYRKQGDPSEVTFVGAAYPNRVEAMAYLHASGVDVRGYGRDWSHDFRDRARTWFSPRPPIPWHRDISRSDAYGVMQGCLANVNIHFNQDGYAMRTFEVPGVGGLQLIDRPDVSEHYDVGTEVLVWESLDELRELCSRVQGDPAWATKIREAGQKRTLSEHTMVHRAEAMKQYIAED